METNQLLDFFCRTEQNLHQLQFVLDRALPMIPNGPAVVSSPEYEDLRKQWNAGITQVPPIDEFRITAELPAIEAVGWLFNNSAEIGVPPASAVEAVNLPVRQLGEYRFRFGVAKRQLIKQRVEILVEEIEGFIAEITEFLDVDDRETLADNRTEAVKAAIDEIENLLQDRISRNGRWTDLKRHLAFSQSHDWIDIREQDWPSVKVDIVDALSMSPDPLEVPDLDLGALARNSVGTRSTLGFDWSGISYKDFERLLFDVLSALEGYENVEWLTESDAPDRGRDIYLDRMLRDSSGGCRIERVIVQAKHYPERSIQPYDIEKAMSAADSWIGAPVSCVIIATSGNFTDTAVDTVNGRNLRGTPRIEMWNRSFLERLLNQHPRLIDDYGLRA
ncbi:restriction endonuclease [Corynebacterium haemomassiliense]|uniref:restriction endonuclease n=1 Tax=Corynebacterium haemomassiliense TaxID=2754726 RepID=UPI00288A0DE3|nr:restriction endonuclease [Corynebacterium haemomassiliense]